MTSCTGIRMSCRNKCLLLSEDGRVPGRDNPLALRGEGGWGDRVRWRVDREVRLKKMKQIKKFWAPTFILLILILSTQSTVMAQSSAFVNIRYVDNSKFPMMEIYASVTDAEGFPIKDLPSSSFTVFEDGNPVANIESEQVKNNKQPLAIAMVVDTSSSMGWGGVSNSLGDVINGTSEFLDLLSQEDQVAIVGFANTPYVVQDFTTDKELLKNEVRSLTTTQGDEAVIYDGLLEAIKLLKNRPEREVIILITDSTDTGLGQFNLENAINEASRWDIPIITIGFGKVDSHALTRMAALTGGTARLLLDSPSVSLALNLLLENMKDQYLIKYISQAPSNGSERALQVIFGGSSSSTVFTAWASTTEISSDFKDGQVVGGTVLLQPEVSGSADVVNVNLLLDDRLLQSINSEPFEYLWDTTDVTSGPHQIMFEVTDELGVITKKAITLNVQQPINLTIQSPMDGQKMSGLGKVITDINALSGISEVEFSVDGKVLQVLTASPYEIIIDWNTYSMVHIG